MDSDSISINSTDSAETPLAAILRELHLSPPPAQPVRKHRSSIHVQAQIKAGGRSPLRQPPIQNAAVPFPRICVESPATPVKISHIRQRALSRTTNRDESDALKENWNKENIPRSKRKDRLLRSRVEKYDPTHLPPCPPPREDVPPTPASVAELVQDSDSPAHAATFSAQRVALAPSRRANIPAAAKLLFAQEASVRRGGLAPPLGLQERRAEESSRLGPRKRLLSLFKGGLLKPAVAGQEALTKSQDESRMHVPTIEPVPPTPILAEYEQSPGWPLTQPPPASISQSHRFDRVAISPLASPVTPNFATVPQLAPELEHWTPLVSPAVSAWSTDTEPTPPRNHGRATVHQASHRSAKSSRKNRSSISLDARKARPPTAQFLAPPAANHIPDRSKLPLLLEYERERKARNDQRIEALALLEGHHQRFQEGMGLGIAMISGDLSSDEDDYGTPTDDEDDKADHHRSVITTESQRVKHPSMWSTRAVCFQESHVREERHVVSGSEDSEIEQLRMLQRDRERAKLLMVDQPTPGNCGGILSGRE